jgi:hypothetical protein
LWEDCPPLFPASLGVLPFRCKDVLNILHQKEDLECILQPYHPKALVTGRGPAEESIGIWDYRVSAVSYLDDSSEILY